MFLISTYITKSFNNHIFYMVGHLIFLKARCKKLISTVVVVVHKIKLR